MKEIFRKLLVILVFSWVLTILGFLGFILVKYIVDFMPSFVRLEGYVQVMLCLTTIPAFLYLFGVALYMIGDLFISYIRKQD